MMNTAHGPRWREELDELTRRYRERVAGLSAEELNWSPGPDAWSVGQILEHVIVTNESYESVVQDLRRGELDVPWYGRYEVLTRLMGRIVLNAVQPDRKRKLKTFAVWEPSGTEVSGNVLERFVEHQEWLLRFVEESAELGVRSAVIPSPATRFLVYDLGTAFDIIVAHEKRHLNQVEETLELLRSARTRGE